MSAGTRDTSLSHSEHKIPDESSDDIEIGDYTSLTTRRTESVLLVKTLITSLAIKYISQRTLENTSPNKLKSVSHFFIP